MDIGVFIPIGNNGWLISETAPQYMPTFDLNKEIVQKAEGYGFDFALSMIKLRGFGGKTEFWEHNLESFTLMAGLAAVTSKIKIFATAATLTVPPAIVARMASTIDSIAPRPVRDQPDHRLAEGRNIARWACGPARALQGPLRLPGRIRQILRELMETGVSDFKSEFLQMDDCRVSPRPEGEMKIICAGSERRRPGLLRPVCRLQFLPRQGHQHADRLRADRRHCWQRQGQDRPPCHSYPLFMIIADETDEAASPNGSSTRPAPTPRRWPGSRINRPPTNRGRTPTSAQLADPTSAVNLNMGTLVGSYDSVARMLDEIAAVPGTEGVLLTFDDFVEGVEDFGTGSSR